MAGSGWLNWSNGLTIGRILATPVLAFLLHLNTQSAYFLAVALFLLIVLSDFLDGWLARVLNQKTLLGQMLDAVADKIVVISLLLVYADMGYLKGWALLAALLILARELLVSGVRECLGRSGGSVHVTPIAKWKTTLQFLALGVALLVFYFPEQSPEYRFWYLVWLISLWLAAVVTLFSGFDYFRRAWPGLVSGKARK